MARKYSQGFTIIELMIAVTVFSVAILITTTGAIALGRFYQQGATKAKLLTAAREIQGQFTQQVQYSGVDPIIGMVGSYNALCIGDIRYRWKLDDPNQFYKDTFNNVVAACDTFGTPSTTEQPLPKGAVVTAFDETESSGLYSLYIRFVIGSQDMFVDNKYSNNCQSNVLGSEFCAVVKLDNTVARKVIN